MNITLSGSLLRCEFRYHPEIIARIKTITGATWDKSDKCWYVPVGSGATLLERFHKAQYSYEALCAIWDAERRVVEQFADFLIRNHVELHLDASGAVCAVGDNVSPLVQDMVRERSAALRELVSDRQYATPKRRQVTEDDVSVVEATEDDRTWHAWTQNALAAQRREEEQAARVYRRRALEQAELLDTEVSG